MAVSSLESANDGDIAVSPLVSENDDASPYDLTTAASAIGKYSEEAVEKITAPAR